MLEAANSTDIVPYYMGATEQYSFAMGEYLTYIESRLPPINLGLEEAALPDRLEKVFKASFPQSNGSPLIQFLLQVTAVKIMGIDLGSAEPLAEAIDDIELEPSKFYPPAKHVDFESTERLDFRIGEIWSIFKDIVHNVGDLDKVTETKEMEDKEWEHLKIYGRMNMQNFALASKMCIQDLRWLEEGRPNRSSNSSRYRSFFRSYVLGLQPTGSPEIDLTNGLTRETLMYMLNPENPLPTRYSLPSIYIPYVRLARRWEEIHGVQFAPADVDSYLGKVAFANDIEGKDWVIATKNSAC